MLIFRPNLEARPNAGIFLRREVMMIEMTVENL